MNFDAQRGFHLTPPKEPFARPSVTVPPNKNQATVTLWNDYGDAIATYASQYGIDPTAALATLAVEAGREGAFISNRVVIRVEARPPILSMKRYGGVRYVNGRKVTGEQEFSQKYGTGQPANWFALADWYKQEPDKALYYTSFGLSQIMGFNAVQFAGFKSMMAMFEAFQESAYLQVKGFFDFVKNKKIVDAANNLISKDTSVRDKAIKLFVTRYNGGGQVPTYAAWLKDHLAGAKSVMEKVGKYGAKG